MLLRLLYRAETVDQGRILFLGRDIARLRDDKRPDEADTIETVEALFSAQVDTGHREEDAKDAQLDLFGDKPR